MYMIITFCYTSYTRFKENQVLSAPFHLKLVHSECTLNGTILVYSRRQTIPLKRRKVQKKKEKKTPFNKNTLSNIKSHKVSSGQNQGKIKKENKKYLVFNFFFTYGFILN